MSAEETVRWLIRAWDQQGRGREGSDWLFGQIEALREANK